MKKVFLNSILLLCALIVGSSSVWAEDVTITQTVNALVTANSWEVSSGSTIGDLVTDFDLDDNISISTTGDENCGSIWGSTTKDWRLYQNKSGDVTVTANNGCTLKSVTFTYSVSNTGTLKDGSTTVASGSSQSISGTSKTFTVGNTGSATNGQVRITQFSVTYTLGSGTPKAATPTFEPAAGVVASGTEITINCATDGVTIYYEMGSTPADPTTGSSLYDPSSKPTVTSATTIKAIAVKDNYDNSDVASASYTIGTPCEAPVFSIASGEVDKGTSVTLSTKTPGATIYYTSNGSNPTTSSSVYSSAISITASHTYKAIAVKEGMLNSAVTSVTYTVRDYAILPFIWEGGGKTSLTALSGVSANGLGSDYSSHTPYEGKMDGAGDYIQVKTNAQPGKVYIGIKMIGGATTSKIKIQESADGSNFTDVQELTISGKQNDVLNLETTNSFASTSRYVRIYKSVHGSNIGVGPITITTVVTGTVSEIGWSSYANANPLDLSTLRFSSGTGAAYYASAKDLVNKVITLTPSTACIPAGEGILINGTANETFTISIAKSGESITNLLVGTTETTSVSSPYVLAGVENGKPYFQQFNGSEIAANKAYLPSDVMSSAAGLIRFVIENENDATDIDMIESDNKAVKFFENGQIYIFREGVIYDALGRKIR